jgi:DNA repair protein RecO (recombination protein O)
MPTFSDDAICLRLQDWSETSQVLVMLTATHGKLSAVAKGAKRQTPSALARFSGGLELLTLGQAMLIVKSTTDLANLTEWNLLDAHWHLRRELRAFQLGMYAADLTHHMVIDHDPHPGLFEALRQMLAELSEPATRESATLRYQWRLAEELGYRPQLNQDAQTGEELPADQQTLGFSPIAGGIIVSSVPEAWRVRRRTVDLLRRVAADETIDQAAAADVQRANKLLCAYFRAILDRQLPTMEIWLT